MRVGLGVGVSGGGGSMVGVSCGGGSTVGKISGVLVGAGSCEGGIAGGFVGVGKSSGTTKSVEKTNVELPYSSINWCTWMTACVVAGSLPPKQNKYLLFCSKTVQAYVHLDQRASTSAKNWPVNSSGVKILIKVRSPFSIWTTSLIVALEKPETGINSTPEGGGRVGSGVAATVGVTVLVAGISVLRLGVPITEAC